MNSHRVVNGLKEATCEVWLNVQEYNIELNKRYATAELAAKQSVSEWITELEM